MRSLIQDFQNFSVSIAQPLVAQLKEPDFITQLESSNV